jgi:hypothetical protein
MTHGFAAVQCIMHDRIKVAAEYDQRPCFFLSGAIPVRSLEYKKNIRFADWYGGGGRRGGCGGGGGGYI